MSITLFLVKRFLFNRRNDSNINTMVKICFISIFIASTALTLIAAIMNGFEHATEQKLQSIHSDLIIQSNGKALNAQKIQEVISKDFGDIVSYTSPVAFSQVLIQNPQNGQSQLVMLKAVDPEKEKYTSNLVNMLIANKPEGIQWNKLSEPKIIFVGKTLADHLALKVGDNIDILFQPDGFQPNGFQPEQISDTNVKLLHENAIVGSLFKTGILEFDEHIALVSLDFFKELSNNQITQIQVKIKDKVHEQTAKTQLTNRLKLEVLSWKDLYPALISALALEKYIMIIILSLIMLIAAMNMISLLFMYITQKKKDIAILQSLGLSKKKIFYVFLILGFLIILLSSTLGVITALIVAFLLNNYIKIPLPDTYYVSYLTATVDFNIIFIITCILLMISLIALLIPLKKLKHINIAHILKSGDI